MTTSESQDAVTARKVTAVIWRNRIIGLIVALFVFLVGSVLVLTRPNVYQSQSSVALLPAATNQATLPNYPNLITSLIPTYVQLVSSPVLLNRVAAKLPFTTSGTQLANDVHAESLSSAAVINIVAQSRSAVQAKQIASAATAVFLSQLKGNGVVIPRVYAQPTVSSTPAAPRTSLLLGMVLLLAIVLGLAAALLWDRFAGAAERIAAAAERIALPRRSPEPDQAPGQRAQAAAPRPREEGRQSRSDETGNSTVRLLEAATSPFARAHTGGAGQQAQMHEANRQEPAGGAGQPEAEQAARSKQTKPGSRTPNSRS